MSSFTKIKQWGSLRRLFFFFEMGFFLDLVYLYIRCLLGFLRKLYIALFRRSIPKSPSPHLFFLHYFFTRIFEDKVFQKGIERAFEMLKKAFFGPFFFSILFRLLTWGRCYPAFTVFDKIIDPR